MAPGDRVAIVAPAGPFSRDELFRGLAWLGTRYQLRLSSRVLDRCGYLAGDDGARAAELASALGDPDVRAIVCARGGYGVMRILDALPWDAAASDPKWLVGFSDVTALHLSLGRRGIASVHGPNVTGLGRSISAAERLRLLDVLEGRPVAPWDGLEIVHGGVDRGDGSSAAAGPVFGGNLALVEAMAAAGRLEVPPGAVVLLEDVTERPYRIDRMLTSLALGGHLARAAAVVFGQFTQCDPGPDGVTVAEVLRERTAALGVPVLAGAPFGHGAPNLAFVHGGGARVELGALHGRLVFE